MKFVAFDIETAKQIPGVGFNWRPHRPLGITCIASLTDECREPRLWFSKGLKGEPAPKMRQSDLVEFVHFLERSLEGGFVPLSWNGAGFDFEILAEESGLVEKCRDLTWRHIDMMFQVVCEKGFPVALANAAVGLGVNGKLSGVEGVDAPALWARGEQKKVLDYVAQDVRVTLAVAQAAASARQFRWRTQRGTISAFPLRNGWLNVRTASQLPLPDTSWMSDPISRGDYLNWLGEKVVV